MSSDWLGALSRQNHSVGRAAPDRLRSAEPAALTGVLRRFYEAERPLPPLRRAASRRTSSAGRAAPDRLRNAESATLTLPPPILRSVESSFPQRGSPQRPARGFPAKCCRRTSSGWLGALLPGKTLPLDEPRLTGFETLNPLLGRTPDDSTERRIVFPAARVSPAPSARLPGEMLPQDKLRLARRTPPRQNPSAGRAAPDRLRNAESAARTYPRRFYGA